MHTIIGTGKHFLVLMICLWAVACGQGENKADEAQTSIPVSKVRVTRISRADLHPSRSIPATVTYLDKSNIAAPSAGFLTEVLVQTGSFVKKGQPMFTIETKEHRSLENDTTFQKTEIAAFGLITVAASANGYIAGLLQQQGEYVQEGTPLCTFTRSDKALVTGYMPFHLRKEAGLGTRCMLLLPDGTRAPGRIANILQVLDAASQSIQILIRPDVMQIWPEGLNLEVKFESSVVKMAQLLPETAILSNEQLDEFWVMKLADDTTGVKIPVEIGMQIHDSVQILAPEFDPLDRFITEGAYGLADTAKITVAK
ncbi:MAG: biotin/lipoyl-binding protein [Bacteroidia bacterium]